MICDYDYIIYKFEKKKNLNFIGSKYINIPNTSKLYSKKSLHTYV